jgi:hypothetical protein
MEHASHASQDKPSTHGMAVVGHHKVYLSHLPMFHTPHDYQVILEVEFDSTSKAIYDQSVGTASELYTIEPETFVLPNMTKAGNSFQATLYKGHFERGGVPVAENVTIKIVKVLYFKKFQPGETQLAQASYILFGNENEQFIAHIITAKPDFDQILTVKVDSAIAAEIDTVGSLLVTLDDLKNEEPVLAPAALQAVTTKDSKTINLETESEIYLEKGDLSF